LSLTKEDGDVMHTTDYKIALVQIRNKTHHETIILAPAIC